MKKLLFSAGILLSVGVSAQYSNNGYPYNGNEAYSYSSNYYEEEYFPEDYYYDFPDGYYTEDFYRSAYNDYRRSIRNIRWNRLFRQLRLASWQIQEIIALNSYFNSFDAWYSHYRYNPDRWYYDRFYALRDILGPQVYIVFQNNYYNGYDPVDFYRDYRYRVYSGYTYVNPRYRNVSVRNFYIRPQEFHQRHGYSYGNYQPRNSYRGSEGFKDDGFRNNSQGGFRNAPNNNGGIFTPNRSGASSRNQNSVRGGGFRNDTQTPSTSAETPRNSGFRNLPNSGQIPRNRSVENQRSESPVRGGGFRNESTPSSEVTRTSGFRNLNSESTRPAASANSGGFRTRTETAPVRENSTTSTRGGGFR